LNTQIRRIIVALDTSAHSQAALEAATALAEQLGAEVVGVFVEDLELVHLARLPFAREVGLTSAGGRSIDPASMERSLKAQAAKARAALEATARRYNVPWSFRVTRGQVANELLAAAAEADMLALGGIGHMETAGRRLGSTARRVVTEARCSVLVQHGASPPARAVLVVYEDSVGADHALARGRELAESHNTTLVVVLAGDADAHDRLEMGAKRALKDTTVSIQIEALGDGLQALRATLDRYGGGLVVIPHDSALLADEPDLLSELGNPVLLTR
jgi:nucleotide-binding universal stress UspA family protein